MDVGFVKSSVVGFCGSQDFKVNIEVCCHFAAVVLCFVWTQSFLLIPIIHFQFSPTIPLC